MTLSPARSLALATGVLFALPPLAQADVIRVAADGSGDFTLIQPAVDAAADGDRIVVATGQYDSFVVDDKALTIVGLSDQVETGTVRVRNLAAGRAVTLISLAARGGPSATQSTASGMWLVDNAGSVRVQGCRLEAAYDTTGSFAGLLVEHSTDVAIADCEVVGSYSLAGASGPGLRAQGSQLALYDTTLEGGGPGSIFGVEGGIGGILRSSLAWCAGTSFRGGRGSGGEQSDGAIEGSGGDGLQLLDASTLYAQDSEFHGGLAGCAFGLFTFCGDDGVDTLVVPPSMLLPVATARRELASHHVANLQVEGLPGDEAFLLAGTNATFELHPEWAGVLSVAQPAPVGVRAAGAAGTPQPPAGLAGTYLGTLGSSGTLHATLDLAGLAEVDPYGTLAVQVVVRSGGGETVLTDPVAVLLAPCSDEPGDCDANGQPDLCELTAAKAGDCDGDGVLDACEEDCDGNGLPDECEIREDPALDLDQDGTLDVCEGQLQRIYVDVDALPGGGGGSWSDAFDDLTEALAFAQGLPLPVDEMWVAEGTYRPSGPFLFLVPKGLALYGGFAGDETSLDQRDVDAHPTILSGDVLGDDGPNFANRSDNAANVVRLHHHGGQRVDGFTITAGYANGVSTLLRSGAGLRADGIARWAAANCTFVDNWASSAGGGLFARSGGDIVSCRFLGNRAGAGAGVYLATYDGPYQIVNCEFSGNFTVGYDGGGLYMSDTTDDSAVSVVQCTFSRNRAGGAGLGGGIYHSYGAVAADGRLLVRNCVLWGNTSGSPDVEQSQFAFDIGTTNSVSYTCIQGLATFPGPDNHGLDPLLLVPLGPDGLAGTVDDDLAIGIGSPAADAGRNAWIPSDILDLDLDGDAAEELPFDLRGNPRRADDPNAPGTVNGPFPGVDMGAHERQG